MPRWKFTVNNLSGESVPVQPLLKKIDKALMRVIKNRGGECSIVFVSATVMRSLNKQYHGQDRVTDVLTFLIDDSCGEIVLCPKFIFKQAQAAGEPRWVFLAHALVHGIVHALGYHHESGGKKEKQAVILEEKILAEMGIEHENF